ncbi:MAG: Holliday junction branch migration protein RuvA [Planctomycetes bacterium]|nr:Holliday junction branch migration protein RuvA [Planctomycetota bacterium]
MFEYLEGRLAERMPAHVVLDVGGVAFRLSVPVSTYDALPASGAARLFTHLRIQEEIPRLYGFATRTERELFLLLNSVSGIGPVTALGILSSCAAAELARAVAAGDVKFLRKLKGVGEKTAQRILLELREPMAALRLLPESPAPGRDEAASADAVLALLSLGFPRPTAEKSVADAARALPAGSAVELLVKEALRRSANPTPSANRR